MLEERIKKLEQEKHEAISKVRAVCSDKQKRKIAIREIAINFVTAKNYLSEIYRDGYKVNDDLSRDAERYGSSVDYRRICNHFEYHFLRIRGIPLDLESGRFKPQFTRIF